jgi:uncharacterized protein Smg (DUF494 family)
MKTPSKPVPTVAQTVVAAVRQLENLNPRGASRADIAELLALLDRLKTYSAAMAQSALERESRRQQRIRAPHQNR